MIGCCWLVLDWLGSWSVVGWLVSGQWLANWLVVALKAFSRLCFSFFFMLYI